MYLLASITSGLLAISAANGKPIRNKHKGYANLTSVEATQALRSVMRFDAKMLPGIEAIGAGYDPFAGYANPAFISRTIFAWDSVKKDTYTYQGKTYDIPDPVEAYTLSQSSLNEVYGQSIEKYQKNLATSVSVEGNYRFFSGSVEAEFSSETVRTKDRSFSRVQKSVGTWALKLPVKQSLRNHLKSDFKNDLDTLDVKSEEAMQDFFENYGSHFLTGIIIGGSVRQSSSVDLLKVDTSMKMSVVAKASFNSGIGGGSASTSTTSSTSISNFEQNSEINRETKGGNPSLGSNIGMTPAGYKAWSDSVVDYPLFVDFTKKGAFTPIWKLTANDAKGKEIAAGLQKYFKEVYAPAYTKRNTIQPDYINRITITYGGKDAACPAGYNRYPTDLNLDTGRGDSVFLCTHKTEYNSVGTNSKALTDFFVGQGSAEPNEKEKYEKIDIDLNKGVTGSPDLFLWAKYEPYNSTTAYLDMGVVNGVQAQPPYGYHKSVVNLNEGTEAGANLYFTWLVQKDAALT
ncbi:MAC/Perforin domain-containing protein [Elsinoe ampelina]|uniref:MAC/Perforin domain-containing protein n=1 Tax=Elsinoe ampelina TaxID=302913 RepID=A0A6A6G7W7_9PEZI|nr:MAC/Perforin domain-containing protein [Elsinoe ampelina]